MSTVSAPNTTGSSSIANALSAATSSSSTSSTASAASDPTSESSFLKLMVAQLNNQDPMNPTSNADMTSQMAQINTVSGISQLNTTMGSMLSQLGSMQTLQGASLTGHSALVPGSSLTLQQGQYTGSFSLPSNADAVTVSVSSPGGQLLDTISLGAQNTGMNNFTWTNSTSYDPSTSGAPTFTVNATAGSAAVTATTLMQSVIQSVSSSNGALQLNLQNIGNVPYSSVVSIM